MLIVRSGWVLRGVMVTGAGSMGAVVESGVAVCFLCNLALRAERSCSMCKAVSVSCSD